MGTTNWGQAALRRTRFPWVASKCINGELRTSSPVPGCFSSPDAFREVVSLASKRYIKESCLEDIALLRSNPSTKQPLKSEVERRTGGAHFTSDSSPNAKNLLRAMRRPSSAGCVFHLTSSDQFPIAVEPRWLDQKPLPILTRQKISLHRVVHDKTCLQYSCVA